VSVWSLAPSLPLQMVACGPVQPLHVGPVQLSQKIECEPIRAAAAAFQPQRVA
jgi:hypothetical protein